MENEAQKRFIYQDGKLFYKFKCGKMLPGTEAGCEGVYYWQLSFLGKVYRRHQVIFYYFNSRFPSLIDHIDGDRLNDRIENLRETTQRINTWNRKLHKGNKSGYRGVHISKNKFVATILINKKRKYLGTFDTAEQASAAFEVVNKVLRKDGYTPQR